jgi:hypothetical protein
MSALNGRLARGQVTPVERYRDDTRGVDLPVRAIIVAPL